MVLISTIFGLLCCTSVYGADKCGPLLVRSTVEVDLWGRAVSVTKVRGSTNEERINEIIPDLSPSDLVVGLEAGHVYILYHGSRYDGAPPPLDPLSLLIGNAKIRKTKLQLARGIIVRLRNLSPEVQSRMSAFFENEGRELSMTCASGACSVLSRTGIRNLGVLPTLSGNSLLKRLITSHLTNPDGTEIKSELYFYDVESLDKHLAHDRLFTLTYSVPVAVIALILYLVT